jgi:hypothetical protein
MSSQQPRPRSAGVVGHREDNGFPVGLLPGEERARSGSHSTDWPCATRRRVWRTYAFRATCRRRTAALLICGRCASVVRCARGAVRGHRAAHGPISSSGAGRPTLFPPALDKGAVFPRAGRASKFDVRSYSPTINNPPFFHNAPRTTSSDVSSMGIHVRQT